VVLLPITHTPPAGDTIGIEIPAKVKQAIGLDDSRSWVIVSEHNIDEWPNAGLSPIPGRPGVFLYGFIPPGLFVQIKARFLELARLNKPARCGGDGLGKSVGWIEAEGAIRIRLTPSLRFALRVEIL
jgi:hypothetical protein